jgi:carbohydrate-selective porin OprB
VKYGLGINVEQGLSNDTGTFFRAMWSDGGSETHAFTEVDRSLAAGVSVKGTQWSRADDTLGVSVMINAISADRRRYLEAGGISFFIGDGALRYRPETILETYYSFSLTKCSNITLDFQRIANPAYNADRGPVNVVGIRLHAEY